MPSPDMSYTNSPAGYSLQTGPAPSFQGGGLDTSGMSGMFQEMARRKAAAAAEEQRRFEIEDARRNDLHQAQLRAMQPPKPDFTVRPKAPGPQMRMGPQGQLFDYYDPQEASLFNEGKSLSGRVSRGPGQAGGLGVYDDQYAGIATAGA